MDCHNFEYIVVVDLVDLGEQVRTYPGTNQGFVAAAEAAMHAIASVASVLKPNDLKYARRLASDFWRSSSHKTLVPFTLTVVGMGGVTVCSVSLTMRPVLYKQESFPFAASSQPLPF
jgi:hypothetical protein